MLAMLFTFLLSFLLSISISFGLSCLEGWITMLLWNAVMPLIWAGAPTLTFWVATGIMFLLNLLFGPYRVRFSGSKE